MGKTTFLIIFSILILSLSATAQKHNIHVTYGGAFTGNYEFPLSYSEKSGSQVSFKVSIGERYHLGYTRPPQGTLQTKLMVGGSIVTLFGGNRNFFELTTGIANGWRKKKNVSNGTYLLLLANVGYRFESNAFLFRVGAGMPEVLYAGIGIRI